MPAKIQLARGTWRALWQMRPCGFLTFLCLALFAWQPAATGEQRDAGSAAPAALSGASFVIEDFDGDSLPDFATVQSGPAIAQHTSYWVQFEFSLGNKRSFAVSAPAGGLQIASRDVNGDRFLDVIISTQLANEPVAVLLNDGRGNFTLADAKGFAASIWGARQEWLPDAEEVNDGDAAMMSSGWAGRVETARGRVELQPALARVSVPCAKLRGSVLLHEVLGRAPPAV